MSSSIEQSKLNELKLPPVQDTINRPSHLEAYGVHCTEPTCNLSDFLPFKCGYCKSSFCASHRLPFAHTCKAYDENEADVRVSLCQWCEGPLRVDKLHGRDTDINEAMEYHISSGACPVLQNVGADGLFKTDHKNGKLGISLKNAQQKDHKRCNFWKCKNILWVEMKCKSCGKSFCPSHRETRAHKCGELEGSSGASSGSATPVNPPSTSKTASSKISFFANASKTKSTSAINDGAAGASGSQNTSVPQKPFAKLSLGNSGNKGSASAPSTSPTDSASKSGKSNNLLTSIKGKTTSNVADMSVSRRAAREREQAAISLRKRAEKG